jgi:glycosyltransferase involved in cell wall biosynthesis
VSPDRPLRVLVDATALPADRGGVGRYVDEIVARLPALGADTHVAAQPRDLDRYAPDLGRDHCHPASGWAGSPAARLVWEQTGLPMVARTVAPDVVHSPHYTLPLALSLRDRPRQVVTLHDATFFSDPDLHLGVKARFFRGWTTVSTRRADALVVPSQATKSEVVTHTRARPDSIAVIPHGVDHARFRPATLAEVGEVRSWLSLAPETSYVAFLGTLEPRKNVPALVRGFVQACAELADPPVLVLAGAPGWDPGVDPAMAQVPEHLTVIKAGFVPDRLVPALLTGARVVAYPAFGEGFGLPVLEAMACGAAVLTTRRLSLPEVGGDAVHYASTPEATDIAHALRRLLADPDECRRLGRAGVARSALFTWEAAAAAHLQVFEKVAS